MSLTDELLRQSENHPDRTILFGDGEEGWTYRELLSRAGTVADEVRGSDPDPRIGILMKRGRYFGAAFFGILFGGGVPVPLNYYLGPDTLSYICEEAQVSFVFGDGSLPEKEDQVAFPVRSIQDQLEAAGTAESFGSAAEDLSMGGSDERNRDLATILFTSGTTAKPKGVKLTVSNLLSNIRGSRAAMDLTEKDHFLTSLPLFHSFGLTCGLLLPLLSGIPSTVQSKFSPKNVLRVLRKRRITVYLAVPSQYRALSRAARKMSDLIPFHDLHDSIRFISGGEPLPEPVREQIQSSLAQPVLEGYGLTETSPVVSVNRLESRRDGTAGKPLENIQVRTADPEDPGTPLDPGERGEIQIKGPSVMDGYLNEDQISKDPFTEDGWFQTGDAGKIDDDGFLQITGRLKELIISAGENISPLHIEEYILKHGSVREAAVVGVPDERKGEVPVAFVSPKEEEQIEKNSLFESIRGKLGRLHVPDEIYILDELPHGPTGKVLKRKLKEQTVN